MAREKNGLSIQYVSTRDLKPYENNAKIHSDEQVEQIISSIDRFGFTNPILVDESMGVIAGHGRLQAAIRMGLKTVPVVKIEGLSDEDKRALVIADNKISENAQWDMAVLADEIEKLSKIDFDFTAIGFSMDEVDEITNEKPKLKQREERIREIKFTHIPAMAAFRKPWEQGLGCLSGCLKKPQRYGRVGAGSSSNSILRLTASKAFVSDQPRERDT